MLDEKDHVMRAVRQLAAALARILGLRKAALLDEAQAEIDAALASIAGVPPALLAAADPRIVAGLVQDPARREAAGRLARERALVEEARGNGEGARAWEARAAALLGER